MKHTLPGIVVLICFLNPTKLVSQNQLQFNENGIFKIVQFTDIHYRNASEKSERAVQGMGTVLDMEKPDVVVLTGDIITTRPAAEGWRAVLRPMIERSIPWTVALGNHDDEHDLSRREIISLLEKEPFSLVEHGPQGIGSGNQVLRVKNSNADHSALLVYCLDSNAYTPMEGVGTYGWFTFPQIEWYRKQSARITAKNNGRPLPALAFFHIPFPEYHDMWITDSTCVGVKGEAVCAPAVNTGMFASMLEAGDVMGVFVGHDHENDYIGVWYGIALAYGRVTGYDAYGDLPRGGRVIEVTQGKREFASWIRTDEGDIVNRYEYPVKPLKNIE